ncbi:hypothetical protein PsYK624_057750 [Phanerochaete sordida]|uniref:Uncharacterized protein n=1 Tax=Phanerochaete sordida TaxID=48140 RepID=A0A9P3G8B4_9APHY|nr:hypothetical protein PsYK624_057750 [Phanerochaete sordida]
MQPSAIFTSKLVAAVLIARAALDHHIIREAGGKGPLILPRREVVASEVGCGLGRVGRSSNVIGRGGKQERGKRSARRSEGKARWGREGRRISWETTTGRVLVCRGMGADTRRSSVRMFLSRKASQSQRTGGSSPWPVPHVGDARWLHIFRSKVFNVSNVMRWRDVSDAK